MSGGIRVATRLARLEREGRRLSAHMLTAKALYESDRLQMAWTHLQAALADLEIAKIGAQVRAPWRREG